MSTVSSPAKLPREEAVWKYQLSSEVREFLGTVLFDEGSFVRHLFYLGVDLDEGEKEEG